MFLSRWKNQVLKKCNRPSKGFIRKEKIKIKIVSIECEKRDRGASKEIERGEWERVGESGEGEM